MGTHKDCGIRTFFHVVQTDPTLTIISKMVPRHPLEIVMNNGERHGSGNTTTQFFKMPSLMQVTPPELFFQLISQSL
jgi:hypothetical protein